jgi:hypothetical protein
VQVHYLQIRFEGREDVFMRIAHHAIGKLSPILVEFPGEFDLLPHKLCLPGEVQMDVGRSTIRTKERDRVDTVVATALVTNQLA